MQRNDTEKEKRMKRNKEICDQVKKGEYESLAFDANASWFPPRPIIKKDKKEMARLYDRPTLTLT